MRAALRFLKEEHGAGAVEFALVLPVFLTLILAILGVSFLMFATTTLHYAAEEAARCYSVKTATCTNPATTQAYALSHYHGPGVSPAFVASLSGCGHTVTGTASYPLNTGLVDITLPLSTTACYP